jgi:hypothetical protein
MWPPVAAKPRQNAEGVRPQRFQSKLAVRFFQNCALSRSKGADTKQGRRDAVPEENHLGEPVRPQEALKCPNADRKTAAPCCNFVLYMSETLDMSDNSDI